MPVMTWSDWVNEATNSILAQTLTDFELLIIGYPDIEHWRQRLPTDSRIQCLTRPSPGIVSALNTGLQAASGHYFARMDADDKSHPDRFEQQLLFLSGHDIDIAGAKVSLFSESLATNDGNQRYVAWLNSLATPDQIAGDMLVECPLAHPTLFARTDTIRTLGGYRDQGWPEDYDLLLRSHLAGLRLGKPDKILFDWRDHPERLSRTDDRYTREQFIRLKVWTLKKSVLAGRDVVLCGTGRIARLWHDVLIQHNIKVRCFVEHDSVTRKTSKRHLPVVSYQNLLDPQNKGLLSGSLIVSAVSAPGARDQIRERFDLAGLIETEDYVIAG